MVISCMTFLLLAAPWLQRHSLPEIGKLWRLVFGSMAGRVLEVTYHRRPTRQIQMEINNEKDAPGRRAMFNSYRDLPHDSVSTGRTLKKGLHNQQGSAC
jgi:hypothetical protein